MMIGDAPATCVVAVIPCPPADRLEAAWRALEARCDPPLFLSWAWIGAQIAAFGPPDYLAQATRGTEVVGLALLGRRRGGWAGRLRRPTLHLNETGDPISDSVMIEYNGLLTSERGEDAAAALIKALLSAGAPPWREVHLSGAPDYWAEQCRAQGLTVRLLRPPQPAPFTDFAALPPGDPLDGLSGNNRQQIRRSLRWFARRGPLSIDAAGDAAEAVARLGELEALHTAAWRARNKPGAFAHPGFGAFHCALIKQAFNEGVPDLLRIRAGSETVGCLYNFLWRGWAYSYQSGLRYEDDPDCRPGLVAHLLAMRRYRAMGLRGYRFLAGDSRYKSGFATGRDALLWMTVRRAGPLDRLVRLIGGAGG